MSKKKNIGQTVVSVIVAFVLSILLTMLCYICCIYFGMFNVSSVKNAINTSGYCQDIVEYSEKSSAEAAIPMGLPDTVFKGVFDVNETRTEAYNYITASIEGHNYEPDTTAAKYRLLNNIYDYVEGSGAVMTDETKANTDVFADEIMTAYSKNVKIPFFNYFVLVRDAISDLIYIAIPVLVILSIAAVVILVRMHKWLHRAMRYIAYSTISVALMTAVFPAYLLAGGIYKRISISPQYVYNFLVEYVDNSLSVFLFMSAAFAVLSVGVIIFIYIKRRKLEEKSRKHHHRHREEAQKAEM